MILFRPHKTIEALNKFSDTIVEALNQSKQNFRGAQEAKLSANKLTAHKIIMANLQSYIEEEKPSDNSETTMNDNDESKELEDVNLIVSHSLLC